MSGEFEQHRCEPTNDNAHAGALAGQDGHQRALLAQDAGSKANGDPEGTRLSRMQRDDQAIPGERSSPFQFDSGNFGSLQLLVERAVQHRLEQMLRALAAGGLRGLQLADFADALGEFLLQRKRGNFDGQHHQSPLGNIRH